MNSFYSFIPVSHVAWMGKLMFLFLQFWFYSKETIKIRHTPDCTEVPKIFVADWYLINQFGCPVTWFCFGEYHWFSTVRGRWGLWGSLPITRILQWKQFRSDSTTQTFINHQLENSPTAWSVCPETFHLLLPTTVLWESFPGDRCNSILAIGFTLLF